MIEDAENRGSTFAEGSVAPKSSTVAKAMADGLAEKPSDGRRPGPKEALEDWELLTRYAETGAEEAFAEIVRRRIGLVYSVALRHTHDAHRAEDVTQRVFTDLARKAGALAGRTVLVGWLYRSAQYAASNAVRTERRRQVREQEAYNMQQLAYDRPDPNWDKLRPVLDDVLNDMDERDRDAVLLRFFDGRGFAEIGAELRLTESAARMRVERALDKMHAALSRRGVTSTTAALGLALANSAMAAPPAGLAASVAGKALAGVASGGAVGWAAFAGSAKVLAGGASVVAALAVGAALLQSNRVRERDAALAVASGQGAELQARLTNLEEQVRRAERRAQDAERDSGELLKAVETARTNNARAAAVFQGPGAEEQRRIAYERTFQADVAQRRGAELKRRAELEDEIAKLPPAGKFNRLVDEAEARVATNEFQAGIRLLSLANGVKPADLPVSEKYTQLQAALQAQNTPVEITVASDDLTYVAIGGIRAIGQFSTNTVRLPPGDYELVGWRIGYQSVVMPLRVRAGSPPPVLTVVCAQPAKD